jgi:TonB family protein
MPITETKPSAGQSGTPSPPSPEPSRPRRGGRRDYEGLEAYDLLHVIDDLEDERSRALLREKIWIALLLHIAIFGYIMLAPKYLYHVKVIDPSTRLRENEKNMTFLALPKDVLKQERPKHAPVVSDKDRVQQTPKPQLDKKTLDQLEAMRRAGPPVPRPAPQPQQQAPPAPAPPQVAQQAPPPVQRPAQPLPNNSTSQIEAPAPRPTQPNFNSGAQTPGEAVQQAARQAATHGLTGAEGGDMGANAPSAHGGMNGAVDVLSDTLGVDFGPYIQRVIYDTKRAWYPIIPPSAQPPLSKQGKVLIRFKILPDGSVKNMILEGPSGDVSLDRAAWGGITGASPFPQLPKNFKGPYLELRFYFLYNLRPGVE